MKINILAIAAALSDQDLLARLRALAGKERETTVELVAHLAALDSRASVYHAEGYSSLFAYCTGALRLSEDAACNRIEAARACRRFPAILDLLATGSLSLTTVRVLARHLTPENHRAVLERAKGRSRREVDILVAELAPRPDVPTSVRKLPVPATPSAPPPIRGRTPCPAPAGPRDLSLTRGGPPDPAADRPGHGAGALPRAVHHRPRGPRQAATAPGTPAAGDPGW